MLHVWIVIRRRVGSVIHRAPGGIWIKIGYLVDRIHNPLWLMCGDELLLYVLWREGPCGRLVRRQRRDHIGHVQCRSYRSMPPGCSVSMRCWSMFRKRSSGLIWRFWRLSRGWRSIIWTFMLAKIGPIPRRIFYKMNEPEGTCPVNMVSSAAPSPDV